MKISLQVSALLLAFLLIACGGGGSNSGSGTGQIGGGGSAGASVDLTLVDNSDVTVANNAMSPGGVYFAKALVRSGSTPERNAPVIFTTTSSSITFSPASGTVSTNEQGIARVQVLPLQSAAATITATARVGDNTVSDSMAVNPPSTSFQLSGFSAQITEVPLFGSTSISVNAKSSPGGSPAVGKTVAFTSSCGQISPANAQTNAVGQAVATFNSSGCAPGNVVLHAVLAGSPAVDLTIKVKP